MIIPTCQVCGTTLDFEDGTAIETVIRRGTNVPDADPDMREFWEWNQQLVFDFCGEGHMKSWMAAFALPTYEPPPENEKSDPFEVLGIVGLIGIGLVVLTGAIYGFLLLLARVF